jgi:hypothetical protein
MGEEVDKRVMEATDSLVVAFDAVREAKQALDDPRLSSQTDQQRNQGFSQASNRVENASKKAQEALRKSVVAASVSRNPVHFACFRQADARLAGAQAELRSANREDDASSRAAHLSIAIALLEQGMDAAKDLIFCPTELTASGSVARDDSSAGFARPGPYPAR